MTACLANITSSGRSAGPQRGVLAVTQRLLDRHQPLQLFEPVLNDDHSRLRRLGVSDDRRPVGVDLHLAAELPNTVDEELRLRELGRIAAENGVPELKEQKAICSPSGENVGAQSLAGVFVNRIGRSPPMRCR